MKDIKESTKMKMAQLTREGNCKKQFHSGHGTYIRSVDKLNSYKCDPIKCPS
jgi:hypothetical protein